MRRTKPKSIFSAVLSPLGSGEIMRPPRKGEVEAEVEVEVKVEVEVEGSGGNRRRRRGWRGVSG